MLAEFRAEDVRLQTTIRPGPESHKTNITFGNLQILEPIGKITTTTPPSSSSRKKSRKRQQQQQQQPQGVYSEFESLTAVGDNKESQEFVLGENGGVLMREIAGKRIKKSAHLNNQKGGKKNSKNSTQEESQNKQNDFCVEMNLDFAHPTSPDYFGTFSLVFSLFVFLF